ncbi:MAG: BON domain-containing protein [Dehalococcoidia bacterium]|nr:BON domain-containing protein [Dehalococcoidia bacterium]
MSARTMAIEHQLAEQADIHLMVEEGEGRLVLSGFVETDDERTAALDLVADLAPDVPVEDNIEVVGTMPGTIGAMALSEVETPEFPGATPGLHEDSLEAGDFTDQPAIAGAAWQASGPTSAVDDDLVSEGDNVYTPPIDPVGTNREVIGGLQASSMDDLSVERSALDGLYGDEAIADAVRRELHEDAATIDLEVAVDVRAGVVRLRGHVPYLEDAENAEEVAARVPGVLEVREELEVGALG